MEFLEELFHKTKKDKNRPLPEVDLLEPEDGSNIYRFLISGTTGERTGYLLSELDGNVAHFSIYVDKQSAGKGYGRKLWKRFKSWAEDNGVIQIRGHLVPDDGRENDARKFYHRIGAIITKDNQIII